MALKAVKGEEKRVMRSEEKRELMVYGLWLTDYCRDTHNPSTIDNRPSNLFSLHSSLITAFMSHRLSVSSVSPSVDGQALWWTDQMRAQGDRCSLFFQQFCCSLKRTIAIAIAIASVFSLLSLLFTVFLIPISIAITTMKKNRRTSVHYNSEQQYQGKTVLLSHQDEQIKAIKKTAG